MLDFIVLERDFENIKEGSEVEIIQKKADKSANGKVVENNSEQLYIRINEISEVSTDTTIKYEDIKSVKIFS